MKRGKGGDSTEAIKAVWMEGYREGLRERLLLASHPDACEHGVRLKNHCATCAQIAETEGR